MREVEKVYKTRRPREGGRGILLLYDNARTHVSKYVRDIIEDILDLSPCDFWLFPDLKKISEDNNFIRDKT